MTLRDFIRRFEAECNQHGYPPEPVWQDIPPDELQWLADDAPGEWGALAHYLTMGLPMANNHVNRLPKIHCQTCNHFFHPPDFCGKHQKPIPATFNQANACNHWEQK